MPKKSPKALLNGKNNTAEAKKLHTEVSFKVMGSLQFRRYSARVEPGPENRRRQGDLGTLTYSIPDQEENCPQKFNLVIWDNADYTAITTAVASSQYTAVTIQWPHGERATNMVKMSAYLDDNKLHIGNVCITLQQLQDAVRKGGDVRLRHPCNSECVAVLTFEKQESAQFVAQDATYKVSKLADLARMNGITELVSDHIILDVEDMLKEVGSSLLPYNTAARSFVPLRTVLPVCMHDGTDVQIHMPHLQRTLAGRGRSLGLPALLYFLHSGSMMEGLNPEDDIANMDGAAIFKVYTNTQTMITVDGKFDKYTSDRAPVGYKQHVSWDGRNSVCLELEDTENIQAPFSQVKAEGDDCEDWAMGMYIVALAFEYHATALHNQNMDEVVKGIKETVHATRCFEKLSDQDLKHLIERVKFIGKCVQEGMLATCLATVAAGAASMKEGVGMAQQPGGHECCVAEAHFGADRQVAKKGKRATRVQDTSEKFDKNDKKNSHHAGAVLEGTNWVNNTEEYNEATISKLQQAMEQAIRDLPAPDRNWQRSTLSKRAQQEAAPKTASRTDALSASDAEAYHKVRRQIIQGVGARELGHSSSFYRSIFSIDDCILMTMDAATNEITTWGTHVDNVLDSMAQREPRLGEAAYFAKISKGEIEEDDWTAYQGWLYGLSHEVQAPPMDATLWNDRMKTWLELQPRAPEAFADIYTHRQNKAYGYFCTETRQPNAIPFMNVYVSVVEVEKQVEGGGSVSLLDRGVKGKTP